VQVSKEDLLNTVEIGTLAMGSMAVAFPRLSARLGGADPDAGANTSSTRALGFWLTTYGALLQFAESDSERDRLLMAGAACGSAYCVNSVVAAGQKRITWRGALTHVAMVGTMVAAGCLYLTTD
jgi:hypothetical protein